MITLFNARYILDVILPLSEASYDSRLPLPPGYKMIAPIMIDTSIIPEPPSGKQFGFIASGPDGIHVVPRGTDDLEEWICDFDALDHIPGPRPGTWRHGGVYRITMACLQSILNAIPATGDLNISGHSLGGGVASELTWTFRARNPRTITLASLRHVNGEFAKDFASLDITRIANRWDIVPHEAPDWLGYVHVGTDINIEGPRTLDLKKAHNLVESYGPGLQKLLVPLAA